jgi:hypothetical protein
MCHCWLPVKGSIFKLFQTDLPLDNGLMLSSKKPSHQYFVPLVEFTVVWLPHYVSKWLLEKFGLLQIEWGCAISTFQVQ